MGGPSSEHDISLMSGKNVMSGLRSAGHRPVAVYVAPSENWFLSSEKGVAFDPVDVCSRFDLMFNAMHGEYGEDGRVQQIFEHCKIPYTGSGVAASALAMNKIISRDIFQNAGLRVPRGMAFRADEFDPDKDVARVHAISAPPWIVKPASRGSSVGVSVVWTFDDLREAILRAFSYDASVLVEEFIQGREVTCGVLDDFSARKHYPLHPVEIIPPEGRIFDYEVKYNGATKEVPAPFFGEMLRLIKDTATTAHGVLGCRHYSRTDMIIKGTKIYVLETNTLPGLTKESLYPKAAGFSRIDFPELLDHIVGLAMKTA